MGRADNAAERRLDGTVTPVVHLVVPLKSVARAKTRLEGALGPADHAELVLALASDTISAALRTPAVHRVLVVAARPGEVTALAALGADVIGEHAPGGLNAALRQGSGMLRAADPGCVVGALQADLPALLPHDLQHAITEAHGRRAFCADRDGAGTTLLLSATGGDLDPRFGARSAVAHAASGAVRLSAAGATLRTDVDTPADLAHAHRLGLGPHTLALLGGRRRAG